MKTVLGKFCVISCALMLLIVSIVPGFAEGGTPTITVVATENVLQGGTVQVNVEMNNIETFSVVQCYFHYNKDIFDIASSSDIVVNPQINSLPNNMSWDPNNGLVKLASTNQANITVSSLPMNLLTITMTVKNDAASGTYPLTLTDHRIGVYQPIQDPPGSKTVELASQVVNASVTVGAPTPTPSGGGRGGPGATLQPTDTSEPTATPTSTPTATPTATPEVLFTDVSGWAEEYVYYLAEKGIILGKSEGIFAPNDNVTRAEFVTILARCSGDSIDQAANPEFTDVTASDWFAPYVMWAKNNAVVMGYEDGSFKPYNQISREELCTMIVRMLAANGLAPAEAELTFADADSISGWAKESVASLAGIGVVSGKGENMFCPKDYATRAETAKIVAIALKALIEQ